MTRPDDDRVVVTGIGLVCALGTDPDRVFTRILDGEFAAREWPDLVADGFPITVANRVEDAGEYGRRPARRGRALTVHAVGNAIADAGLGAAHLKNAGVYVGSTMGESAGFEAAAAYSATDLDDATADTFAAEIAREFGTNGTLRTYGTACAAGNYAIGSAARAIASGRIDVAIAGGVDAFSRIAMLGFARVRAMSPDRCRPFDRNRRGMQLGEGAAFLVLERERSAARRGARRRAVIGSLGLSGDAHHPTAPRPDGSGSATALRSALRATGVRANEIGWINAHGTGTAASDAAESAAVATVFGDRTGPPVSSLKGAFGHCMGAAAAVEAAMTVLALERHVIPPTVGVLDVDDQLPIDVVVEPRPAPDLRWALNCGNAFGGLNSALLIGAAS